MVTSKKATERIASVILGEKTFRATGSGVMDEQFTTASRTKALTTKVTIDGEPSGTEEFTISIHNPSLGTAYDIVAFRYSMEGVYSLSTTEPSFLEFGDIVTFGYLNPDNLTWSVSFVYGDE
jgi:hypothetical protein